MVVLWSKTVFGGESYFREAFWRASPGTPGEGLAELSHRRPSNPAETVAEVSSKAAPNCSASLPPANGIWAPIRGCEDNEGPRQGRKRLFRDSNISRNVRIDRVLKDWLCYAQQGSAKKAHKVLVQSF